LDVRVHLLARVAATPKINDLDSALLFRPQKDVFGFQVAVNDASLLDEVEGLENLDRNPPNKREAEAFEAVLLHEFVEVDRQQLKLDENVVSELESSNHPHNVAGIFVICFIQILEDRRFDLRLEMELLLVLDDLQGDGLLLSVVVRLDNDSERSFPERLKQFVAKAHVIVLLHNIILVFVVVDFRSFGFGFRAIFAQVIHALHLFELFLFVLREEVRVHLQGLVPGQRVVDGRPFSLPREVEGRRVRSSVHVRGEDACR
jgi:hypothetical protein